ncbi:hypothetical protein MTR67_013161 [Solanum verrucosum]|uniref:Gag-pol polyprotein n=1 Tax=Solanum verrucosum TaxID=315347 RepID=A0AAF0THN9_SOLVR|nr:hypothetical protein MTR67_013161 [Solanum verrucosum]
MARFLVGPRIEALDMTTTRDNARRNKEDNLDQEVSPQALIDPLEENITNVETKPAFQLLDQAMTAQANRDVVAPVNPNVGTASSRMRDFIKMNPSEFYGFKVEEDPQEFIDEVCKVLAIMGVTSVGKAKLAAYQLKDIAQVWL